MEEVLSNLLQVLGGGGLAILGGYIARRWSVRDAEAAWHRDRVAAVLQDFWRLAQRSLEFWDPWNWGPGRYARGEPTKTYVQGSLEDALDLVILWAPSRLSTRAAALVTFVSDWQGQFDRDDPTDSQEMPQAKFEELAALTQEFEAAMRENLHLEPRTRRPAVHGRQEDPELES